MLRQENVDGERFDRWGHGATHPMRGRWEWIKRSRAPHVPAWNDFWQFVRDIGDRPSSTHRLYRVDAQRPYGPQNFEWRDRTTNVPLTDRNAYMRAYYAQRPERNKHYQLKQQYGISFDDYEAMRKAQDNKCAICRQPEKAVSKKTRKVRDLAVDHDHTSGAVRGLLCTGCNSILGNANDNISILEAAIAYLKRHQTDGTKP